MNEETYYEQMKRSKDRKINLGGCTATMMTDRRKGHDEGILLVYNFVSLICNFQFSTPLIFFLGKYSIFLCTLNL